MLENIKILPLICKKVIVFYVKVACSSLMKIVYSFLFCSESFVVVRQLVSVVLQLLVLFMK